MDIHEQLRELLDRAGVTYRVIEHPPEGRTEFITKIRGNRLEQAIKSIVVQVRLSKKVNVYCLANVPGDCRVDLDGIRAYFGRAGGRGGVQPPSSKILSSLSEGPPPVPRGTGAAPSQAPIGVAIAPRDKAEALTGCPVGAIPPFSFNDELIVLADPLIAENEESVFNAGRLDRSIFMQTADYIRLAKPELTRIAIRS